MKIRFVVAAVFGLVAGLIYWKLSAFVGVAFIFSAIITGFLIGKNNEKVADKFK